MVNQEATLKSFENQNAGLVSTRSQNPANRKASETAQSPQLTLDFTPISRGQKAKPLNPKFEPISQHLPSLFLGSLVDVEFYLAEPFSHRFTQKIQSNYTLRELTPKIVEYFGKIPYQPGYRLDEFKFKYMNEVAPLDIPLKELFSDGGDQQTFARIDVIFKGKKTTAMFTAADAQNTQSAMLAEANPAVPEYLLPRSTKGYTTEPSLVELARM